MPHSSQHQVIELSNRQKRKSSDLSAIQVQSSSVSSAAVTQLDEQLAYHKQSISCSNLTVASYVLPRVMLDGFTETLCDSVCCLQAGDT